LDVGKNWHLTDLLVERMDYRVLSKALKIDLDSVDYKECTLRKCKRYRF